MSGYLAPASNSRHTICRAKLTLQKLEAQIMHYTPARDRIHEVFSIYLRINPDLHWI